MTLSTDTIEILKFLDYTSGNNLRKRNDLGTILEIGAIFNEAELIDKIIFSGKYLWNLSVTIKKSDLTEGLDKLHEEFRKTGEDLRFLLIELLNKSIEEDIKRFEVIYFQLTAGCFNNLVDLSHDLSELKEVQNSMKQKQ